MLPTLKCACKPSRRPRDWRSHILYLVAVGLVVGMVGMAGILLTLQRLGVIR